jgi:hypothetical protein
MAHPPKKGAMTRSPGVANRGFPSRIFLMPVNPTGMDWGAPGGGMVAVSCGYRPCLAHPGAALARGWTAFWAI